MDHESQVRYGRKGGRSTSRKKQIAARANGLRNKPRNLRLQQIMTERDCSRQRAYVLLKRETKVLCK